MGIRASRRKTTEPIAETVTEDELKNRQENEVSTETTEPTFEDFDVDAPTVAAEDTVETPESPSNTEKPAKEKKESTRPPVPEGKVSPVAFAKLLSEHKTKQAR